MYYFDLPKAERVFKWVTILSLVGLFLLISFLAIQG